MDRVISGRFRSSHSIFAAASGARSPAEGSKKVVADSGSGPTMDRTFRREVPPSGRRRTP